MMEREGRDGEGEEERERQENMNPFKECTSVFQATASDTGSTFS